jgi:hypothetical protein
MITRSAAEYNYGGTWAISASETFTPSNAN